MLTDMCCKMAMQQVKPEGDPWQLSIRGEALLTIDANTEHCLPTVASQVGLAEKIHTKMIMSIS